MSRARPVTLKWWFDQPAQLLESQPFGGPLMGHGAALSDQRRILRRCTGACATMVLPCRAVRCELPVVTHGAGHSFAAARSYRDMLKDLDTVVEVASDTSTPV